MRATESTYAWVIAPMVPVSVGLHAKLTGRTQYVLTVERAPGLFEPYIHPYKRWRDKGTDAIKSRLEDDQRVIVISMDLKSYYPSVDLNGLRTLGDAESGLWTRLGFDEKVAGKEPLTLWERQFTDSILDAVNVWQEIVQDDLEVRG
ncbi:MAG: hypothetical protein U5L11_16435 [Arhodomonas sp.]|nr:hypothetical protein [Arhodomonas sp.]